MIDVLVFLFENYFDISTHPAPNTLVRKLSAAGFDPEEISLALDWLHDLKTARPAEFFADRRAIRIYSEEEQAKLAPGCLDFIAFLESVGFITPRPPAVILDRAIGIEDDQVELEKLKIIVLMVLWSQDQDLEPLIIEELLHPPEDLLLH